MYAFKPQPAFASARKQRGVIVILVVLSLGIMIAMAGLALDGGNLMINKTRLQNIADAAALSAAKTLHETEHDALLAEAEAFAMFADAANDLGHASIDSAYQSGTLNVVVEFSETLIPFTPGTTPANYVRVTATNLVVPTWLMRVVGQNQNIVDVSAVSGPSVSLGFTCNIAPMMVCEDPDAPADDPFRGYEPGRITVLKAGSANESMEKGNFQLIRLDDAQGGADIRAALAGSYDACLNTTEIIETEPGNTVGPVAQGLNTRFGVYQGPMGQGGAAAYPPDKDVSQSPERLVEVEVDTNGDGTPDERQVHYNGAEVTYAAPTPVTIGGETYDYYEPANADIYDYSDYEANATANAGNTGVYGRRLIAMPIGECGDEAGQSQIPYKGTLCFFVMQTVSQGGGEDEDVFGQFAPDGCPVTGTAGPVPTNGPGPYVIQLYKDEARVES